MGAKSGDLRVAPGPLMMLGNMREQGVHHLIAFYLNDACRHQSLIDVSKYPDDVRPSAGEQR
jgi:hypothetical protein